jgi:hypothetical protein
MSCIILFISSSAISTILRLVQQFPTVGSTQQVQPYPTRFEKETPEHPTVASVQIFGYHYNIHHSETVSLMRCLPARLAKTAPQS